MIASWSKRSFTKPVAHFRAIGSTLRAPSLSFWLFSQRYHQFNVYGRIAFYLPAPRLVLNSESDSDSEALGMNDSRFSGPSLLRVWCESRELNLSWHQLENGFQERRCSRFLFILSEKLLWRDLTRRKLNVLSVNQRGLWNCGMHVCVCVCVYERV